MQNEILERLKEKISSENIKCNEPMSKHTSFKVGGNADIFITIHTAEEMLEILKINQNKLPITVVGNGTNILVKDSGIRGIVVKFIDDKIERISKQENTENKIETISEQENSENKIESISEQATIENIKERIIKVSAGTSNAKLGNYLLKNNLSGFECITGIPRNTRRSSIYECRCIWWRNKRYCKKCYIS